MREKAGVRGRDSGLRSFTSMSVGLGLYRETERVKPDNELHAKDTGRVIIASSVHTIDGQGKRSRDVNCMDS